MKTIEKDGIQVLNRLCALLTYPFPRHPILYLRFGYASSLPLRGDNDDL